MKSTKSVVVAVVAPCVPVPAHAGTRDPGVNRPQANQQAGLHQGVHSGELTRHEARRLEAGQRRSRPEERAYKSNGKLIDAERTDLHQDLISAVGRTIYTEKRDADQRN